MTNAPLQVDYQVFLMASVASVFDMVADHEQVCRFVPNLEHGGIHHSEQGLLRLCDFGNDMVAQECIVRWQPPSAFEYTMLAPNPFGIREHYATVTCQPYESQAMTAHGTLLRWQHYFEHDDLDTMLSMLNTMFDHIFTELIKQFHGYRLNNSAENKYFYQQ